MKTLNIFSVTMVLMVLGSCYSTKNLPKSKNLNTFPYGSTLQWKNEDGKRVQGELLAVEDGFLYVLPHLGSNYSDSLFRLEYAGLTKFSLIYVKPKSYYWTIPLGMAASIAQGFMGILSLPINLISAGFIINSTYRDAAFNQSQISYGELKEYARFPQGMPKEIDIAVLKLERKPLSGF
jgi:hypothetical protein